MCTLCGQEPETVSHLIIGCVFARQAWFALLHSLQLDTLMPEARNMTRTSLTGGCTSELVWSPWTGDRPLFDSMLLLIAWLLWKERNRRVFGRPPSSLESVLRSLLREGEEWALAGFLPLVRLSEIWSQNHVSM